jgi:hypothetical protein
MADNFKATVNGKLQKVNGCLIVIPGENVKPRKIVMRALPDISDSKQAIYNGEGIIGRSAPLYTYSHSGDRNINMQIHFFVVQDRCNGNCGQCPDCNLTNLRWIQSACYPRKDAITPYKPPPICRIKCGDLLAKGNRAVCAVLQSYSVRFPTEVAWDTETGCPYRFDVDTSWLVVYSTEKLPFQNKIYTFGK